MTDTKPKVLFIDDQVDLTNLCKIVLASAECHIESASSGASGIECVKSFKPDVVFLDMVLQDMSGVEVAKKIFASLPEGVGRPVVYAFTNHRPDYFGRQLEAAGIRRCVPKVMDLDGLRNTLRSAIAEAVGGNGR